MAGAWCCNALPGKENQTNTGIKNRFLSFSSCQTKCSKTTVPLGVCRGLALLSEAGVVSASHDQTLRVWTLAGECVALLQGHSAIIYSAAVSQDGNLIASAAEDNTARLWRPDGLALQTIEHPGEAFSISGISSPLVTSLLVQRDACLAAGDLRSRADGRDVACLFSLRLGCGVPAQRGSRHRLRRLRRPHLDAVARSRRARGSP